MTDERAPYFMTYFVNPDPPPTEPLASLRSATQTIRTASSEKQYYAVDVSPLVGFFDSRLSAEDQPLATCGHRHVSLSGAWRCSLMFDPEDPFDVLAIRDGRVVLRHRGRDYHEKPAS